ncbi:MAG: dTDP-L-rhamnose 4-epimerase [Solirubrobacterales bacterium]|jgi:dTDP-L-rhamnose 4-epimerase|nr:dTDP-L-rhamnose 4-epimerase [Solirubrobacterales bacterium]
MAATTPSGKVLITGGAGFIGSHLVDRLLDSGREVRVLDSVEPQVHGSGAGIRNPGAEYLDGTVLDRDAVDRALDGVESVVHLAAQVGVGQSAYEIYRYVNENCTGTAVLLERLAEVRDRISSLVVASSMSIYGEGRYACDGCGGDDVPVRRSREQLEARDWEPLCAVCGARPRPLPTPETKRIESDSIYATTKRDQEELCLIFGRGFGIRSVALRLFNVYGTRQSLSNPYTGVAAIFASRLLNGSAPTVYEDGLQSRDFVHVSDIARAFELALERDDVGDVALNVGTGNQVTVLDVAHVLARELGVDLEPEIVNKFRQGDIRHCFGDITAIREQLGYEPSVSFDEGMAELTGWLKETAPEAEDRTKAAAGELESRGLIV